MEALTDVWTLEAPDQEEAHINLGFIIEEAFKFSGVSERAYLRKLWDGENWPSIRRKLETEGSGWYVWYMDGVNAHLRNMINGED